MLVHLSCREALIELTVRVVPQNKDTEKRCPHILDSHINYNYNYNYNYLRPAQARSTFASGQVQ